MPPPKSGGIHYKHCSGLLSEKGQTVVNLHIDRKRRNKIWEEK